MGPLAIVTYLIVYGKTRGEHDSKLAMLFQQPKERSLTLNREKCLCSLPRLTSFGCVISTDGTFPNNKKVEVILETRAPSNLAEVHSFLGLVTCCPRFIPHFASNSEPLHQFTCKEQKAFEMLKNLLTRESVMGHYS